MKQCKKCKIEKDNSEFYKHKDYKDGLCSSCKECQKEYQRNYSKNSNYKESQKEYQKSDKRKKWQKSDKCKEYKKKYRKTDKSKKYQKEYNKEYRKKRKLIDPKYKLDCNMASAISTVLKGNKTGKKWKDLVGYSVEDLIKHLESKFEPWMNWNNYGKWHVDHIRPISSFNYTCHEDKEFKDCWALSNLQPLEAIANIRKGNKY